MKVFNMLMLFGASCFLSFNVFAGNGELVPRKGLGPLDKAKVHEVQAQKWSRIGMGIEMENEAENSVSQYSNTSGGSAFGGRSKNCSTNIGNVAAQKGASSGRYGPKNKNNNVVVVKGDVINVCK